MHDSTSIPDRADGAPEADEVLAIVVGAHLEAEVADRPLADGLRDRIRARRSGAVGGLHPIVLTDLWYLNNGPLRTQPTIAIGGPEVNAATAYLASRVPTAFVVEDRFRIHMDPELLDVTACLWGVNAASTADALACFEERYLDDFLRSAHLLGSESP